MKTIIFQKDIETGMKFQKHLSIYGDCEVIDDGVKVIDKFTEGFENGEPFDLICLDIMVPKLEGVRILQAIRALEIITGINNTHKIKSLITLQEEYVHFLEGFIDTTRDTYVTQELDSLVLEQKLKELNMIEQ